MAQSGPYPTIWKLSDDLWQKIEKLLARHDPPARTGRPPGDRRPIMNAIIYRFLTGVQWNQLPREFGDDSTIHRVFQHWVEIKLFRKICSLLVVECDELGLVNWPGKPPMARWAIRARQGEWRIPSLRFPKACHRLTNLPGEGLPPIPWYDGFTCARSTRHEARSVHRKPPIHIFMITTLLQ